MFRYKPEITSSIEGPLIYCIEDGILELDATGEDPLN